MAALPALTQLSALFVAADIAGHDAMANRCTRLAHDIGAMAGTVLAWERVQLLRKINTPAGAEGRAA